jgi:hypothetical protein
MPSSHEFDMPPTFEQKWNQRTLWRAATSRARFLEGLNMCARGGRQGQPAITTLLPASMNAATIFSD